MAAVQPAKEDVPGGGLSEKFFEMRRSLLIAVEDKEREGGMAPGDPELQKLENLSEAERDVHQEAVAQTLEDPALIDHMERARDRYYAHQAEQGKLQHTLTTVRPVIASVTGKLAAAIAEVNDAITPHSTAGDEIAIICRYAVKHATTGKPVHPHFPDGLAAPYPTEAVAFIEQVSKKVTERAETIHRHDEFLKKHKNKLSVVRSELLPAVERLIKYCESLEKVNASQRELLKAVAELKS